MRFAEKRRDDEPRTDFALDTPSKDWVCCFSAFCI